MNNISDWLNRADYTADERRNICAQLLSEAQYWDITQYLKMMHDSTKRPWVGLTDEEMQDCIKTADYNQGQYKRTAYWAHLTTALATAIEQALKEKNT